jgi:hypothetical protein
MAFKGNVKIIKNIFMKKIGVTGTPSVQMDLMKIQVIVENALDHMDFLKITNMQHFLANTNILAE